MEPWRFSEDFTPTRRTAYELIDNIVEILPIQPLVCPMHCIAAMDRI